jgi:hypothetical protein
MVVGANEAQVADDFAVSFACIVNLPSSAEGSFATHFLTFKE